MRGFFKTFGLIIGFNLLWSVVFFIFQPKSRMWADMGILEAFIYLLGNLAGDAIYLIISLIFYLCLLFLKRLKKIQLDNIILFFLGYILVVIIAITIHAWYGSRLFIQFNLNIASLTSFLYTPFIYSFISYNLLKSWILKKK